MLRPIASIQASLAGCLAFLATLVALHAYGMVALILLSRHLTSSPPVQTLPLYFDYSTPVATAAVALGSRLEPFPKPLQQYLSLPLKMQDLMQSTAPPVQKQLQHYQHQGGPKLKQPTCGVEDDLEPQAGWQAQVAGARRRVLSHGQQVRVSVLLRFPSHHSDLFQLAGELLTEDGELIERSVRTHIAPGQPLLFHLFRQLALAPCFAVGLCSDIVSVEFPLFDSFTEQDDLPLQHFRALLSSRSSAEGQLVPPPVREAVVRLEVQMGIFRKLLYWVRPSLPTTIVLTSLAGLLGLGASGSAMLLALAALLLRHIGQKLPVPPVPAACPSHALALDRDAGAMQPDADSTNHPPSVSGQSQEDEDNAEPTSDDTNLLWQEEAKGEMFHEADASWADA